MKKAALRAIKDVADAHGAQIVNVDGETAVLEHKGCSIIVRRDRPGWAAWSVEIQPPDTWSCDLGAYRRPSEAVMHALLEAEHLKRRELEDLEFALLDAIPSEYICQGSSVEDGACSVFLLNAPDAPARLERSTQSEARTR